MLADGSITEASLSIAIAEVPMSSSDPLPEPPEPEPREPADVPPSPSGSPPDRPRPDDHAFTDRPVEETWAAPTQPDYDRDAPLAPQPPAGNPLARLGVFGTIVWWFVRPGTPHPQFWWAVLWTMAFFVVSQIIGAILGLPLGFLVLWATDELKELMRLVGDPVEFQKSEPFAQLMGPTVLVCEVLSIVFGWFALRLMAGRHWPRKVALRLPSMTHLILTLLLLPAFMLVGQAVSLVAKNYVPSMGGLEAIGALLGHWPWWLGVLLVGFGPGIGEELFCRGFLGRGLVGNYGYVWGVILTSVLFGIMHIEPIQVIYAPVLGIMLHFVYLTSRSLLLPMLLHTLNNSLGVLQAWSEGNQCTPAWVTAIDQASDQRSFLVVYAGAVVLLLAVGVGLYISRARMAAADGVGPPLWKPAYDNVEYPPPDSGMIVVRPLGPSLAALGLGLAGFLVFVVSCLAWYAQG
jgi:membrane protease YdiL (CAAX protease family)